MLLFKLFLEGLIGLCGVHNTPNYCILQYFANRWAFYPFFRQECTVDGRLGQVAVAKVLFYNVFSQLQEVYFWLLL